MTCGLFAVKQTLNLCLTLSVQGGDSAAGVRQTAKVQRVHYSPARPLVHALGCLHSQQTRDAVGLLVPRVAELSVSRAFNFSAGSVRLLG